MTRSVTLSREAAKGLYSLLERFFGRSLRLRTSLRSSVAQRVAPSHRDMKRET
jgi:hypothetical protein